MAVELAKWRAAEDAMEKTDEAMIRYQADYVQRLIERTDYPSFNIEGVVQCFLEWEHNKHEVSTNSTSWHAVACGSMR